MPVIIRVFLALSFLVTSHALGLACTGGNTGDDDDDDDDDDDNGEGTIADDFSETLTLGDDETFSFSTGKAAMVRIDVVDPDGDCQNYASIELSRRVGAEQYNYWGYAGSLYGVDRVCSRLVARVSRGGYRVEVYSDDDGDPTPGLELVVTFHEIEEGLEGSPFTGSLAAGDIRLITVQPPPLSQVQASATCTGCDELTEWAVIFYERDSEEPAYRPGDRQICSGTSCSLSALAAGVDVVISIEGETALDSYSLAISADAPEVLDDNIASFTLGADEVRQFIVELDDVSGVTAWATGPGGACTAEDVSVRLEYLSPYGYLNYLGARYAYSPACVALSTAGRLGTYVVSFEDLGGSGGQALEVRVETTAPVQANIGDALSGDVGYGAPDVYYFPDGSDPEADLLSVSIGSDGGTCESLVEGAVYVIDSDGEMYRELGAEAGGGMCGTDSDQIYDGTELVLLVETSEEGNVSYTAQLSTDSYLQDGDECDRGQNQNECEPDLYCLMTEVEGLGVCGVLGGALPASEAEIEPNETTAQAQSGAVVPPASRDVHVEVEGDGDSFDVFALNLAAGQSVTVTTHDGAGEGYCGDGDTYLYWVDGTVLDAEGFVGATENAFDDDDDGADGLCSRLVVNAPDGGGWTYVIAAEIGRSEAIDFVVSFTTAAVVELGGRCDAYELENICADGAYCSDYPEYDGDGICE